MIRVRLALGALALAVPGTLAAQGTGRFPPDSLRNIKVLPSSMSVRDVIDTMRGFTFALGVRCPFCHVGEEGRPLSEFDFPSDDKSTKTRARVMIRMVQAINRDNLSRLEPREDPPVEVTCMTCHRGVAVPRPLDQIVALAVRSSGLDSATRTYRSLRERYYGRAAYDFGEGTLIGAAQDVLGDQRYDDALGLLQLNAEFYPQSAQTQTMVGEVYRTRGDTTAAVAAYRRALQIDPNERGARQRLRQLGQQP